MKVQRKEPSRIECTTKEPNTAMHSTRILAMEHDPSTLVLLVTFCNGRRYKYDGVSVATYNKVRNAESIGYAFQCEIVNDLTIAYSEVTERGINAD